jgi:hypothetical protein
MRTAYALLCLVLLMPVEARAQCINQPLRPIASTHTMPPNPEQVRGTTVLEVHIDVAGVSDFAKIIHPPYMVTAAGVTSEMEERARLHVMQYWRRQPPALRCEVIPVSTRVTIEWN